MIPPDVHASEGYNHIGDISWDRAEGGRVLLPLECYVPGGPNGGNPCLHGSIGVADPGTLQWRYYVKLDPAEIPKAMWNEVSPDGTLLWTSSGGDLLAYRAADISLANAAPAHAPIHSVRRLQGRGAADGDHRRDVRRRADARRGAGRQDVPRLLDRPRHRGARARDRAHDRGRVGGARHRGGEGRDAQLADPALQPGGEPADLQPRPRDAGELRATAPAPSRPGPPAAGSGAGLSPALRFFHRTRRTVLRRGFLAGVLCPEGCRATLTVKRGHHLLARTSKRVRPGPIAKVRVKLTKRGRRVLREDHRRLRLTLRAALRLPSGAVREAQGDRPAPLVKLDARELAAIFAGGFLGAIARAELVEALPHDPGEWPWATFVVNVAGAFMLGYFVTRLQERLPLSAYRRPFLGTGLVRRADHVLDHAARAAADARRQPRRAGRRLRGREHRRRLPRRGGGDQPRAAGEPDVSLAARRSASACSAASGAIARFLLDGAVSARGGPELPVGHAGGQPDRARSRSASWPARLCRATR